MLKIWMTALVIGFLVSLPQACPGLAGMAYAQSLKQDQNAAVILSYGRIDEDFFPETNIRFEQFESHVREMIDEDYNVISLTDLIEAFETGTSLPEKTIAITFEGAYKSALDKAIPLLLDHGLPFTVFYASDSASANTAQYMNWSDLRALARNKNVALGLLPASYKHILDDDLTTIMRSVNKAKAAHRDYFKNEAPFFSYPFGEYTHALREKISSAGFKAAFGLQSGVAHHDDNLFSLPRFTMTEQHGGLERFRLVTRALPLPVHDIEPDGAILNTPPASIGFTIDEKLKAEAISCFINTIGKVEFEAIGQRIEIPMPDMSEDQRLRLNCTLPVSQDAWRWFGLLFFEAFIDEGGSNTSPQGALPEPQE